MNLIDRQIEHYSDPDPAGTEPSYRQKRVYHERETVTLALDDQTTISLKVADTLAPP